MQHIRLFFTTPEFQGDEEKTRIARLLSNFLWGSIIIALVTLPPVLLTTQNPLLVVVLHGCTMMLSALSLRRVRQGYVKWVALALPVSIGVLVLVDLMLGARPFSIGVSAGFIAVVFTGMVSRWRTLFAIVGMNVAIAVVSVGYWFLFKPHLFNAHNLLVDAMGFIWYCIIMGFVVMLSMMQFREASEKATKAHSLVQERNAELLREVTERRQTEANLALRTSELTQLLEMSKRVSATLDLGPLLETITESLKLVVNYDSISISECVGKTEMSTLVQRGSLPILTNEWVIDPQLDCHLIEAIDHQASVVISDVRADTVLARSYRERYDRLGERVPDSVGSAAYVPLVSRNRVIGLMTLQHAAPNVYSVQSLRLVTAFANQIAVSLENARLHEKAVQGAALAERSRLARELHDSVSQALFGIVLGSRTLMSRTSSEAPQSATIEYVLSLAEAALAEMRALIFELRPESLQSEGLVAAFRKQAGALCSRHKIEVNTESLTLEPALSIEAKEALYRIGLEAIQNTIKHARATHVDLRLFQDSDRVMLEVMDNGRGFNTEQEYPGHLGLHTMRERAEQLGGSFALQSAQGHGTLIQVKLPILPITHVFTDKTTRIRLVDTVKTV